MEVVHVALSRVVTVDEQHIELRRDEIENCLMVPAIALQKRPISVRRKYLAVFRVDRIEMAAVLVEAEQEG